MDRLSQGFAEGERVAWLSVWTLLIIGIFEVIAGFFTNSIGLTADGVDSLSDAVIALIVWSGLRFSRRKPDHYFHFGYHKVESFGAFVASIGMIVAASFILYKAYLSIQEPHVIKYPALALTTLLIAGTISLYRAFQMRGIANRYGLLSLRAGANNSIKDSTASFLVFASIAAATTGFPWMDPVGAIIIAVYIYSVSYVAIKESSLILMDAFSAPELLSQVTKLISVVPEVRAVPEIRLRHLGPFVTGRIGIAVDPNMTVAGAQKVVKQVESVLGQHIEHLRDLAVYTVPLSSTADPGGSEESSDTKSTGL